MHEKNEHNNPRKSFKEQDDLLVNSKRLLDSADKLISIRRSEITSTAPDDMNWNNIYAGKQHGVHSTKPAVDSRRKRTP